MKKKPVLLNKDYPTRPFLSYEIAAGCVTPDMGSIAVHNNYKDTVRSFKFPESAYSSTFASRLAGLWNIFARDRYRASNNKQALYIAIHSHPPPTQNSRCET